MVVHAAPPFASPGRVTPLVVRMAREGQLSEEDLLRELAEADRAAQEEASAPSSRAMSRRQQPQQQPPPGPAPFGWQGAQGAPPPGQDPYAGWGPRGY